EDAEEKKSRRRQRTAIFWQGKSPCRRVVIGIGVRRSYAQRHWQLCGRPCRLRNVDAGKSSTTTHHAAPPLPEIGAAWRSRSLQVGEHSTSAVAARREQLLVALQIVVAQRRWPCDLAVADRTRRDAELKLRPDLRG